MSQRASTTYGELSEDEQSPKTDFNQLNFKNIPDIIKGEKVIFKSPKDEFKKVYSNALLAYYEDDIKSISDRHALDVIKSSTETSFWNDLTLFEKELFDFDDIIDHNLELDFTIKEIDGISDLIGKPYVITTTDGNRRLDEELQHEPDETEIYELNDAYQRSKDNEKKEATSGILKAVEKERLKKAINRDDKTINKSNWKEWWKLESEKEVISFPKNLSTSAIEDMLQTISKSIKNRNIPSKLPKEIVAGDFPPSTIYLDKKGNFVIECAVAGWSSDKIKVTYSDNYIHLKLDQILDDWCIYLQKGIKFPSKQTECQFFIDTNIFIANEIKTQLKNGILTITVPKIKTKSDEMVIAITETN